MGLKEYKTKRDFTKTPEPTGAVGRKGSALRYVIQKHDASRLHYDFRLELDGVLKSWAVPKGPSLDPGRKSLAVQVEDHPVEYGDFEGVIPKGQYGGGTVMLWDRGIWEPLEDPQAGLRRGKVHFSLEGEKLHGEWSLVRMHGKPGESGKNWLLIKGKDRYASNKKDITASAKSVKTSRSLEQIAGARDDVWDSNAEQTGKLPHAEKAAMPAKCSPQLAVLAEAAPTGTEWLHEIKFDGYRILAQIKSGKVRLFTRNGHDWTHRFPSIAKALEALKVDSAIVDGEAVVLDSDGRSDFQALQAMLKSKEKADPVFYIFDLPYCDGFDLRQSPLLERKRQLETIFKRSKPGTQIRLSEHVIGDGDAVAKQACTMSLEGIISKRIDSPYVSRRDGSWLKSKCGQRQEFVVIGYTEPQGSRAGFGSLLLGYHDDQKRLVYAGRVGTGFNDKLLAQTLTELKRLEQTKPPTHEAPPTRERKHAHWVKPTLVAEVRFTGWTRDGVLRHPAFIAFRSDKPASKIVCERPVTPAAVKPVAKPTKARPKTSVSGGGPLVIEGILITHPDKVLDPDSGTTKQQIAEYYVAAAEWMLPHVVGRPLALVRCPGGRAGKCFFQRNWSDTMLPSLGKVDVGDQKKRERHVTLADLSGIIALAQMGVMEIHTWNCRNSDIESPDQIIFDLDPGPDVSWKQTIEAARHLRKTLESLNLPTFLKTSGGKGLHITVPIEPNIDWDSAKQFSQTIAKSLVEKSDKFVANMRKDLRGGKVYIDYNRNGRSATAVAPYSTRARPGVSISMPISWEELGKLNSADHFKVETARRYLEKRKSDPWREFEQSRVDLRKLIAHESAA